MTRSNHLEAKKAKYNVEWQDPSEAVACPCCNETFGIVKRKHHCRLCGLCVCANCSKHKQKVEGSNHMKRTCDRCVEAQQNPAAAITERIVSAWITSFFAGEAGATATLFDEARRSRLSLDAVLQRATSELHEGLSRQSDAQQAAERATVCVDEMAQVVQDFLTAEGAESELELLCNTIMSLHASAELINGNSSSESPEATVLSDVAGRMVEILADCIYLDMLEMMQAQLFQPKWYDSDLTIRCVEATFYDFFEDLQHWLPRGTYFASLLDICLKRFVQLYIELLLAKGVILDGAGSVAARIRGDLTIIRQFFLRYEQLPPESVAIDVAPFNALAPLLDTPATLSTHMTTLQASFGSLTLDVVKGLLYMHTSVPDADREALLRLAVAAPPATGEGALTNVVAAPRRHEEAFYPWDPDEEERGNEERARPLTLRRGRAGDGADGPRPMPMCRCFWTWLGIQ